MNIIPINSELKKIPFLYIENEPFLNDLDKDYLEMCLGGLDGFVDLKDYNIEYHFNAYSSPDTFEKITKANYILLNTSFTGASGDMLYNFILGAKQKGLKDKIIINCTPFSSISNLFDEMKSNIIELDKEQNIKFYFQGRGIYAFVKYNNDEGFFLL